MLHQNRIFLFIILRFNKHFYIKQQIINSIFAYLLDSQQSYYYYYLTQHNSIFVSFPD